MAVATTTLKVGDMAPAFTAETSDGKTISSQDVLGTPYVLYFYPKDDTPGCTKEACAFRDLSGEFAAKGARIFGVSKDSPASHAKFSAKYSLLFPLLSDTTGATCEAFGVWQEKKNYGKTYMGIVRSTFVVAGDGVITAVFSTVRVEGHADKVLAVL
ncbi:MAG: thioredoxin-dependent thiol peroxidase [Candidatus Sericytochromatia bacterium]|nr:thioredoxin-dependent thiol peroxidase [Candidatus Sericytochromatia bacterium]